jgi:hypothetical protein
VVKKVQPRASERKAEEFNNRIADYWARSERKEAAMLLERSEREKLYGGARRYGEFMTPELERRVRDSVRIVNLAHTGAGRKKDEEALALKVQDEIGMLRSRGVITEEQKLAAERLQRDFFAAGLTGAQALDYAKDRVDYEHAHPDDEMAGRIDAIDRYIAAIRLIPAACWPAVRDIVLEEKRVDAVRTKGLNYKKLRRIRILTLLQVGLEQLAEHYEFKRKRRKTHIKREPGSRPRADEFGSSAVENDEENT